MPTDCNWLGKKLCKDLTGTVDDAAGTPQAAQIKTTLEAELMRLLGRNEKVDDWINLLLEMQSMFCEILSSSDQTHQTFCSRFHTVAVKVAATSSLFVPRKDAHLPAPPPPPRSQFPSIYLDGRQQYGTVGW